MQERPVPLSGFLSSYLLYSHMYHRDSCVHPILLESVMIELTSRISLIPIHCNHS